MENLLDENRLRAGALAVSPHSVSLAEAIGRSMNELGSAGRDILVQVPDDLPEAFAEMALWIYQRLGSPVLRPPRT